MSEAQGTMSATEPDPTNHGTGTNHGTSTGTGGGTGGGGGGGGGGLVGIAAVQKAFLFLDGPADVLSASTACRRWCELACAGSVWRAKAKREGIMDKAAAFEVEVPRMAEGDSHGDGDGATASMAFYARVFVLRGYKMRDEDRDEDGHIINSDYDFGIYTAAWAWCEDPAATKAKYGPIASWDVSEITDFSDLFTGQADFNEDLSRWKVLSVVNMDNMFDGATTFTGDLSHWNVSSVEDMGCMFEGATSFNGNITSWNVSNVVNMALMFRGATSFNGDLSRWNVSDVENMGGMFWGATSFNGDLSCWDVSNVDEMGCMFEGATSFDRQLDGAWSTSTATKGGMFRNSPGIITRMTLTGPSGLDRCL